MYKKNAMCYAKALEMHSNSIENLEQKIQILKNLLTLISCDTASKNILFNRWTPIKLKLKIWNIFLNEIKQQQNFHDEVIEALIMVMMQKHILMLLPDVVLCLEKILMKKQGILPVNITIATKIDDTKEIEKIISDVLKSKIAANFNVNKNIIGGVIIECESKRIDLSIKGKIDFIKNVAAKI